MFVSIRGYCFSGVSGKKTGDALELSIDREGRECLRAACQPFLTPPPCTCLPDSVEKRATGCALLSTPTRLRSS